MDPENRAAINMDGVSVWLDVPFEELVARIPIDGRRPLAADRAAMERLFADARGRLQRAPASGSTPAARRRKRWPSESSNAFPDPVGHPRERRRLRRRPRGGASRRRWDRALVLGDLVGYGAEPNAVIERVLVARSAGGDPRQPRQGGLPPGRCQRLQSRRPRRGDVDRRSADAGKPDVPRAAAARARSRPTTRSRSATARRSTRTTTSSISPMPGTRSTSPRGRSASSATRICR